MKRATELPYNVELRFFRQAEIPMWEYSPKGGCWIVKLYKDKSINEKWEQLLFACIGERFNDLNVIGVVLSLRMTVDIIQVWIKDQSKGTSKSEISTTFRDVLGLDFTRTMVYFKDHKKSIVVSAQPHTENRTILP